MVLNAIFSTNYTEDFNEKYVLKELSLLGSFITCLKASASTHACYLLEGL